MSKHELSGSFRRYSGTLLEPLILYSVLILMVFWASTSSTQLWIRLTIVAAYEILSLAIVRFLHHESIIGRLGISFRTRWSIFYATSFMVAATAIAFVNAQSVNYSNLEALLLAPIGEEVFFRSYMLGSMSKLGKYLSVVVTAFLFGSAHFMRGSMDVGTFVTYFIVGCILGSAYLHFGSILIPVMIHQTANMLAVGYYPPYAFPMSFVGVLAFLAPTASIVAGARVAYGFYTKKPVPTCWICGRSEREIKSIIPEVGNVLEDYPVSDGAVKICIVCKRLHSTSESVVV